MTIRRETGTLHVIPTHVSDPGRSGASRTGFDARGRRPVRFVDTNEIERLYRRLGEVTPENHPRTAKLLASSTRKVAQKVFEEGGEVALEAVRHDTNGIVRESADLLYHLVALWYRAGIRPDDVWTEMRNRAEMLGIAEKLPKLRGPTSTGGDNDRNA